MSIQDLIAGVVSPVLEAYVGYRGAQEIARKVPKIPDAPIAGWDPNVYTGWDARKRTTRIPDYLTQYFAPQGRVDKEGEGVARTPSFWDPGMAQSQALQDLSRLTQAGQETHDRTLGGLVSFGEFLGPGGGLERTRQQGSQAYQDLRQRGMAEFDRSQQNVTALLSKAYNMKQEVLTPILAQIREAGQAIYDLQAQTRADLSGMALTQSQQVAQMMSGAYTGIQAAVDRQVEDQVNTMAAHGMDRLSQEIMANSVRGQGSAFMWDAYNTFAQAEGQRLGTFYTGLAAQMAQSNQSTQIRVNELTQMANQGVSTAAAMSAELQRIGTEMDLNLAEARNTFDANATITGQNWEAQMRAMWMDGKRWFVTASSQIMEPVPMIASTMSAIQAQYQNLSLAAWATKAGMDMQNFQNTIMPTMVMMQGITGGINTYMDWRQQQELIAQSNKESVRAGQYSLGGSLLGFGGNVVSGVRPNIGGGGGGGIPGGDESGSFSGIS